MNDGVPVTQWANLIMMPVADDERNHDEGGDSAMDGGAAEASRVDGLGSSSGDADPSLEGESVEEKSAESTNTTISTDGGDKRRRRKSSSGEDAQPFQPRDHGTSRGGRHHQSAFEVETVNLVIEALRSVEPTVASVSNCSIDFQSRFAHSPSFVKLCLQTCTDYFLTVDPSSKLHTFYVLNDLIQRDPRFRLDFLTLVLPNIYWTVSRLPDRELYMKTVTIWEQRRIYPVETCRAISEAFSASIVITQNATEFEQRLASFADMARIRAVKDSEMERLLDGDLDETAASAPALKAATAAAIMAASAAELKTIGMTARASLTVTQGTIEYLARLLLDFSSGLSVANTMAMKEILAILKRATLPTTSPPSSPPPDATLS